MAKELTFEKDGGKWVAETTVSADYHLHVERAAGVSPFNIKPRAAKAGQRLSNFQLLTFNYQLL